MILRCRREPLWAVWVGAVLLLLHGCFVCVRRRRLLSYRTWTRCEVLSIFLPILPRQIKLRMPPSSRCVLYGDAGAWPSKMLKLHASLRCLLNRLRLYTHSGLADLFVWGEFLTNSLGRWATNGGLWLLLEGGAMWLGDGCTKGHLGSCRYCGEKGDRAGWHGCRMTDIREGCVGFYGRYLL